MVFRCSKEKSDLPNQTLTSLRPSLKDNFKISLNLPQDHLKRNTIGLIPDYLLVEGVRNAHKGSCSVSCVVVSATGTPMDHPWHQKLINRDSVYGEQRRGPDSKRMRHCKNVSISLEFGIWYLFRWPWQPIRPNPYISVMFTFLNKIITKDKLYWKYRPLI